VIIALRAEQIELALVRVQLHRMTFRARLGFENRLTIFILDRKGLVRSLYVSNSLDVCPKLRI
jgi:hypothetical protein